MFYNALYAVLLGLASDYQSAFIPFFLHTLKVYFGSCLVVLSDRLTFTSSPNW